MKIGQEPINLGKGQRVKTGVVAVVFPVEDVPLPRQMPFFMPLLEGMETEAVALGLDHEAGSLAPRKRADMLAVAYDAAAINDPYAAVLADDRPPQRVWTWMHSSRR